MKELNKKLVDAEKAEALEDLSGIPLDDDNLEKIAGGVLRKKYLLDQSDPVDNRTRTGIKIVNGKDCE